MPAPRVHDWVAVLTILVVFVFLPLWLSFKLLRWILRLAFLSGVGSQFR